MFAQTGWFKDPEMHHVGWFRVFRGSTCIEIWFGHRWFMFAL